VRIKNLCVRCGNENYKNVAEINLCETCEKILFETMLKTHIPKSIKSVFLKDR